MSKLGKINIAIPEKVKLSIEGSNLKMEGPLGKVFYLIGHQDF